MNKKLIIIAGRDGRPSMKGTYKQMKSNSELHVRRRLQTKKGLNEYWRIYTNHNVDDFEKVNINNNDVKNNIIIRWGNTIPMNLEGCITYNKSESISKATNKKLSRQIFTENNLSCPKLINFEADINNFPVIARPSKHSKGKNFVILNDLEAFRDHFYKYKQDWYYSEYINKVAEYRLHIGHGKFSATLLSN